jgi:hypothetical protein
MIHAWLSPRSVRFNDGWDNDSADGVARNAGRDFRCESRSNETHASRTDPESRLARQSHSQPAQPSFSGHVLMENPNGLVAAATLGQATGTAERDAAVAMIQGEREAKTLGADKGYDTRGFVAQIRSLGVTPHVACNAKRSSGSTIDERTTRHESYQVSQRMRKRIEEVFGWAKTIGPVRRKKLRGWRLVRFQFGLTASTYNLV